eukprot:TRINITY_DN4919_c0_g1_i1.p1 TRINITY_DN4919_c0_g1~~TRINITY_DN4919_c0_g1_i1.p1  ORF type:complete len:636 (+),score=211.90 TRINITY_DN4919_c0_g1_i1:66-1973(+)
MDRKGKGEEAPVPAGDPEAPPQQPGGDAQPAPRVVLVQRLPQEVSVEDVVHLAGNAGRVTGRYVQEKTRHVFIEMETHEQALALVQNLGNISVKGHQLKSELSTRYAEVVAEKVNKVLVLSLPGLQEWQTDCQKLAAMFNSKGGQVQRMQLWLTRDGIVQGLVEMDSDHSAQVLREQLSGYVMGTATVRLSYSNKQSIVIKQPQFGCDFVTQQGAGMCPRRPESFQVLTPANPSLGVNASAGLPGVMPQMPAAAFQQMAPQMHQPLAPMGGSGMHMGQLGMGGYGGTPPQPQLAPPHTPPPLGLQGSPVPALMGGAPQPQQQMMGMATQSPPHAMGHQYGLPQVQHMTQAAPARTPPSMPAPGQGSRGFVSQQGHQVQPLQPHGAGEYQGPTTVLVKNLLDGTSPDAIFRLFGTCGDVKAVKIMYKKRTTAVVQFATPEGRVLACKLLHGCPFYDASRLLEVQPSRMGQITGTEDELTRYYHESHAHVYRFSNQRLAQKNYENIHGPSNQLHISNVPVGVPSEDVERALRLFSDVVLTSWMGNKGHEAARTKMCIVALDDVRAAVAALIGLHTAALPHQEGGDKGIVVSFSKKAQRPRRLSSSHLPPADARRPAAADFVGLINDPVRGGAMVPLP